MTLTNIILSSLLALQAPAMQRDSVEVVLEFESSVRAIEVVDNNTIIFSGFGGLVGISKNSGKTWDTTIVKHNDKAPAFRACASLDQNIFITSIESPGLIFKIPFNNLSQQELVYKNEHPSIFLNAMAFTDQGIGVVMGDPTDGCLTLLIGENNGEDWSLVPCGKIPKTKNNEAAFAASNGNISIIGEKIWIASGGGASRVFHSRYSGVDWVVYDTPMNQGREMTGAFAISFRDNNTGLLIGGDWGDKKNKYGNLAITNDGGKNWELIAEGTGPGYRSSIVWHPTEKNICIAIGSEGIDISRNEGYTWKRLSKEGYFTGRFSPDGSTLWLAGQGKIGKMSFDEN